jgi:hypothetical protein
MAFGRAAAAQISRDLTVPADARALGLVLVLLISSLERERSDLT